MFFISHRSLGALRNREVSSVCRCRCRVLSTMMLKINYFCIRFWFYFIFFCIGFCALSLSYKDRSLCIVTWDQKAHRPYHTIRHTPDTCFIEAWSTIERILFKCMLKSDLCANFYLFDSELLRCIYICTCIYYTRPSTRSHKPVSLKKV